LRHNAIYFVKISGL